MAAEKENRTCQNCKAEFVIELEDFQFYEKIQVPPPTFCWKCRFQRRAAFRNERKLFRIKSAFSGKEILSLYPPESGVTVFEESEWASDQWDAMDYGSDYDFSKTFFEQLFELDRIVPRGNRDIIRLVASDYSANASDLKNCYLLFNSNVSEDCAYGNSLDSCKSCFDNSHLFRCERYYESFWISNSYQTHFSSRCEDCIQMWFSKNCRGCSNCFGCVNLTNKKYHIFNAPYSREEYEQKLKEFKLHSWDGLLAAKKAAHEFWLKFPNRYLQGTKNVNVSGEYVTNSKNVKNGYLVREGENLKYVQYLQVPPNKDCYDITVWGYMNELAYENVVCGEGVFNVKFSAECWPNVRDLEYCMFCHDSSNLFGCAGLKKKKFCILNKQYSKEEFFQLRERIIKHMNEMPYVDKGGRVYKYGEFFPIELSPFAYNQTIAQDQIPLSREEVETNGYKWRDPEPREYEITMTADQIPDSIDEVRDDILRETIQCSNCKKAYRLIGDELSFLKKERIPVPRTCVDCRHSVRITQRNKIELYRRRCACDYVVYKNADVHSSHPEGRCPNMFETAYAPERPEIVYCESCYNSEII